MATATKSKKSNSDKVMELLEGMTVLELADLVKSVEEKFGISASMPVFQASQGALGAESESGPPEEKTEFSVILTGFGDKKIQVIKEVRSLTSLGLKEAKDLVEGVPQPVKEGIPKEEAEKIQTQLTEAGATVEVQ